MKIKRSTAAAAMFLLAGVSGAQAAEADYLKRTAADEVIYFVLPDRFENADPDNDTGGIEGGRLEHGFDPTRKGFYNGGDLKGLTARLDYIAGLGATAIWLGPIYKNQPVQGPPGDESSGYHGYWITDFTTVDPHFGTPEDMKAFVDAAHAKGMKVYLDIITNHTADVIKYVECHGADRAASYQPPQRCEYRSKADYPYSARGGAGGAAINDGFLGDGPSHQTAENFAKLTDPSYAYTPYAPAGSETVKTPAWLNDPLYYHNRGDFTLDVESSLYGDFSGLDDLLTEHPRVVEGFIDIYKQWITDYRIDGFRIDTARHVNSAFWQAFAPAMIAHAESLGIPNFYIFGEVFDPNPAALARFTHTDKLPYVLDFGFQSVVTDVVANGAPTMRLAALFDADALYEGGADRALGLPTFLGNHDMGRFAHFVRKAAPDAPDATILKRVELGHAMMFLLRGAPVIYYGDEQGFVGDGGDQDARENMFASKVAIYNDNDLVGTDATTAEVNFDTKHPLYRSISRLAKLRREHEALRRGAQIVRRTEVDGGLFAVSRIDDKGGEYLVVFNAGQTAREAMIETDYRSTRWMRLTGDCAARSASPGSVRVVLPPLSYAVCKSNAWNTSR